MTSRASYYEGNDHIIGNEFDNYIDGHNGDDLIQGFGGNDTLFGSEGDDELIGGAGIDHLDGGIGIDIASYRASNHGVYIDLGSGQGFGGHAQGDTLVNIENIVGSDLEDTLIGDTEANYFTGGEGNDSLFGGAGNDMLFDFGVSDDFISGGEGNDVIIVTEGENTIIGGLGNDYLEGGIGNDKFQYTGGDGTDRIVNFNANQDLIDLISSGVSSLEIIQHLQALDNDVILDLSQIVGFSANDKIIFENINIEEFNVDVFITDYNSQLEDNQDIDEIPLAGEDNPLFMFDTVEIYEVEYEVIYMDDDIVVINVMALGTVSAEDFCCSDDLSYSNDEILML